jgi:hypothetical protein
MYTVGLLELEAQRFKQHASRLVFMQKRPLVASSPFQVGVELFRHLST